MICLRLFEHCDRLAASRAACTAGNSSASSSNDRDNDQQLDQCKRIKSCVATFAQHGLLNGNTNRKRVETRRPVRHGRGNHQRTYTWGLSDQPFARGVVFTTPRDLSFCLLNQPARFVEKAAVIQIAAWAHPRLRYVRVVPQRRRRGASPRGYHALMNSSRNYASS